MTFVADESVAGPIVHRLRADGWTILDVRDVAGGAVDPDVLALAVRSAAVLLTEDKDFGELVFREHLPHLGIVLLRVDELRRDLRSELVSRSIRDRHTELPGAFTVVTPGGVRVRRPDPPAE